MTDKFTSKLNKSLKSHGLKSLSRMAEKIYYSDIFVKIKNMVNYETRLSNYEKMAKHPIESFDSICSKWNTYYDLLDLYKGKLQKNTYPPEEKSNKIWILWLQGINAAPDIVKISIKSMINNFGNDHEIIILDEINLSKYVKLPNYIEEKYKAGFIKPAHYSDIIRTYLLSHYGGLWADATVFCTGKNFFYDIVEKQNLFLYKEVDMLTDPKGPPIIAGNWFIYSTKNNPVMTKTLELLYYFWETQNEMKEYYTYHIILKIVFSIYKDEWKSIPTYSDVNPHILLFEIMDQYDEKRFDEILKMSDFHKLNRRFEEYPENSFCNYIITTYLQKDNSQ